MDMDFVGLGVAGFLLWLVVGIIFVLINLKDKPLFALIMYLGGSALVFYAIAMGGMLVTFLPCIGMLAAIVILGYFIIRRASYTIGKWLGGS